MNTKDNKMIAEFMGMTKVILGAKVYITPQGLWSDGEGSLDFH